MQSEEHAIAWLGKAARKGHVPSMAPLAQLLTAKPGERMAEGVEWFRKAAEAGDVAYVIFELA